MAAPAAADARAVHCKGVMVSSEAFRIGGVISRPESFKAALRVKATRAGRKPYFLPSGDLVSSAGSAKRRIVAGEVAIENRTEPLPFDRKKGKGRWRSIPVEVRDVRFAGEYEGGLELGSGGCKVHFSLTVEDGADLALVGAGTKAVRLKLVTCRHATCAFGSVGAWANSLINSASSRRDSVAVSVENASQSPAEITSVQVVLSREVGGDALSEKALVSPAKAYVGPQGARTLPAIGIDRGEISPGHYSGAIYLTVAGAERRVLLPVELDVKDGPTLALVVLLSALLVQFIVELATRNRPRPTGVRETKALRKKAKVELGDDARLLQPRLDEAEELAHRGRFAESKAARARIDKEIGWIQLAQALEQQVRARDGAVPADVSEAVDRFQAAVQRGDGTSEAELGALEEAVDGYGKARAEGLAAEPALVVRLPWWHPARQALEHTRYTVVEIGVRVLPLVAQGALVAVFLLGGLKELYASNSTFGAQLFFDYAGLFLWGLTAAGFNFVLDGIRRMAERF
jgi:hypothetical protein